MKKVTAYVKLQIKAGQANPAPPIGPALGSKGVNIMEFCKQFNARTAKDQGLVLNPSKVSGQCGRLKCCLVYEQATYAEMRKGLPKLGKRVITPHGEGRVVEVDVLRQRIRVATGPGEFHVLGAGDVKPMFPSGNQPHDREPEPEHDADAHDDHDEPAS